MKNPLLVSMSGPMDFDYNKMSDFEAGLGALALIGQLYPGITFGQLPDLALKRPVAMGGWLTDLTKGVTSAVGNVKDGIGDVLKDTFTTVGGAGGDVVRLATDKNVLQGASAIGGAYLTGGASAALDGILGNGGAGSGDALTTFLSALGLNFKSLANQTAPTNAPAIGGTNVLPWVAAGGAVLLVVLLTRGGRR